MMDKASGAYRTISEVADDLDIPQHVLRFWETRFPQIRPMKRSGGRRYYRPGDVLLLRGIRRLLYGEGYTIKGVQRILSAQGIAVVQQAGGASGEELALAVEGGLGEAEAGIGAMPAEDAHEPELDLAEDAVSEQEAPATHPPQEAKRSQEVAMPATAAGARPLSKPPQLSLSAEDRRVLETALEELRACARDLATLRESAPDRPAL
jgi:DNA-binding transcriptional MerR regulator